MLLATTNYGKTEEKPPSKPAVSAWPFIGLFGGVLVLALCLVMIPDNAHGALAQRYHLPEIAGILCFLLVGRTRSSAVLMLCLLLLPTLQACLLFGPSGCLGWARETTQTLTQTLGL